MTIKERQDEIIEDFEVFDEWMDKYEHIIEIGKDLPELDAAFKVSDNIVKGCQSQVWLVADSEDGKLQFKADSDAIITKGLVGLVCGVFTNTTPDEILNTELYFIEKIGLKEHLSPNRSNGLAAMVKQIKFYAIAYSQKQNV